MKQTREEVLTKLLRRLEERSPIANTDPGSIARTFTEILSEEFYEFYNQLEVNTTMSFVSTAEGLFLDMLGRLMNCTRYPNEQDGNYRARITSQVYTVAGANELAIRLRALSVPGVSNVVLVPFTKGSGSFTVYVVSPQPETPTGTLLSVENVVMDTAAYGIRVEVKRPVLIPVDVKVRMVFKEGVREEQKTAIKQTAKEAIQRYANSVPLAGTLFVNDMLRTGIDVDRNVVTADVYEMRVRDSLQFVRDTKTEQGERIHLRNLEIL